VPLVKLNPGIVEAVLAAYRTGQTQRAIADSAGLAQVTIHRIVAKHLPANERRIYKPPTPPEIIAEATRLYLSGEAPKIVSKAVGISKYTFYLRVMKHLSPAARRAANRKAQLPAEVKTEALKRYRSGESPKKIRESLGGFSKSTLSYLTSKLVTPDERAAIAAKRLGLGTRWKFGREVRASIRNEYRNGKPMMKLCAAFGCTWPTVQRIINRRDVLARKQELRRRREKSQQYRFIGLALRMSAMRQQVRA
jgi:hypothetical protein